MNFEIFRGKRIVITGHTGFKGSWLATWLHKAGALVTGVALDPPAGRGIFIDAVQDLEINDFRLDIRTNDRFSKVIKKINPHLVFHLAAQPLVLKSYDEPIETFDTNIMGTIYLLQALRDCPATQGAVCITTDKVYENKESPMGYIESDHLGGYDPYSSSKAASEIVISSYARSFFNAKGIPLVSARAGNVIGGGDWAHNRLIPDYFRAFANNQTLEIRSPNSIRPWQHVLEPLSGYLTLGKAILEGNLNCHEAFNFGPKKDAQSPVSKIVKILNDTISSSNPKSFVNVKYVDPKHHETSLLWLNCQKAEDQLGWCPRLDIETTLKLTSEFYLRNLAGASRQSLRELMLAQIIFYAERIYQL